MQLCIFSYGVHACTVYGQIQVPCSKIYQGETPFNCEKLIQLVNALFCLYALFHSIVWLCQKPSHYSIVFLCWRSLHSLFVGIHSRPSGWCLVVLLVCIEVMSWLVCQLEFSFGIGLCWRSEGGYWFFLERCLLALIRKYGDDSYQLYLGACRGFLVGIEFLHMSWVYIELWFWGPLNCLIV